MKAIWKGAIGFGLVNIPVKLFSATESTALDFDMLERKSLSKIRYKKVNEDTGKEVDWDNIVKGYFYKDKYIVMEDADFEEAAPEKAKLIEIKEFVNTEEISPMLFETPYFVQPEKTGMKAYALLRQALLKSGKVGVSTFVMRNAEILAIVKPYDDMIVLHKLRFPEEIRSSKELQLPPSKAASPAELKIAMALIKQFTSPFKPAKYKDEYAAELMKIIRLKAAGKRAKMRKLPVARKDNSDLMTQLKAGLSKKRAS